MTNHYAPFAENIKAIAIEAGALILKYYRGDLQVEIKEDDSPVTIAKVLERMEIPPSTVLTIVEGQIVPHTSTITGDIEIELIIVSSGG